MEATWKMHEVARLTQERLCLLSHSVFFMTLFLIFLLANTFPHHVDFVSITVNLFESMAVKGTDRCAQPRALSLRFHKRSGGWINTYFLRVLRVQFNATHNGAPGNIQTYWTAWNYTASAHWIDSLVFSITLIHKKSIVIPLSWRTHCIFLNNCLWQHAH